MTNMPPLGVRLHPDVQVLEGRELPYKARVRWTDPTTKKRRSASQMVGSVEAAEAWINAMERAARGGLDPSESTKSLKDYGSAVMSLALRGLEPKTTEPYKAGWIKRVIPTIGHIPVRMITSGVVDRAVHDWIADGCSMSTIKNTVAVLVRVMEQALRDGIVDRNPARVVGWQSEFRKAEDELEDPRALALPDWQTLTTLADTLVERSHEQYQGWGDVVRFAACTAARIGEVSGCRVADIDTGTWTWRVRRQTTTGPGGLVDKGTKGKRARVVPLIPEIRDLVIHRLTTLDEKPDARLFTGPKGGRISTAVLRDATHWDDVVRALGFEHLRRHDLRHTGLTWMADAGVPLHVLRKVAGHGNIATTQRYLHPDHQSIIEAGNALSAYLTRDGTTGPQLVPGSNSTADELGHVIELKKAR